MRAVCLAIAALALVAPAFADPGLGHIGGSTYGEDRITASTARYWNNCVTGVDVGASLVLHDCSRIIGARLSRTRTASALYFRGRAYRDLGRTSEAQSDFLRARVSFDRILYADAGDAMALYGRGLSLIGLGRSTQGAADIDRATAIDSNVAADFARLVTF
ncbi:MAG: hypothetical protein QM759_14175 [Terricaulis sp.]